MRISRLILVLVFSILLSAIPMSVSAEDRKEIQEIRERLIRIEERMVTKEELKAEIKDVRNEIKEFMLWGFEFTFADFCIDRICTLGQTDCAGACHQKSEGA